MLFHRHLKISGKVQGVFYRASAKQVAETLQLKGWVKNTAVGNVEIFVTGEEERVEKFIRWCKQGPPMAEVKNVIVQDCAAENVSGFEIKS